MNRAPRIAILSKGTEAASTRFRLLNYQPLMERAGWSVWHERFPKTAAQRRALQPRLHDSDLLIIGRRLPGWVSRRWLKNNAPPIVFDFDDAIFLRDDGREAPGRARRFEAMMRMARLVLAGNRYLAQRAREAEAGEVVELPTVLPSLYDASAQSAKRDAALTCVWLGSAATGKYLSALLPTMEAVVQAGHAVRLRNISDFALRSNVMEIENVPWSPEAEQHGLTSADVGLAPNPDDPWTRGKCACKLLQYLAAGLDVLASDLPYHQQVLDGGRFGRLLRAVDVDTDKIYDDWAEALIARCTAPPENFDPATARTWVESHYTLEAGWQIMREALLKVLEDKEVTRI